MTTHKPLDLGDEHKLFSKQTEVIEDMVYRVITKNMVNQEKELFRVVREQIHLTETDKLERFDLVRLSEQPD